MTSDDSSATARTTRRATRATCVIAALGMLATTAVTRADATLGRLQIGQPLPRIAGEQLTGRGVSLPEAAAGKATLLLLGFTYKSRFPVEAWAAWFRSEIGAGQAATFYEMPMIGGLGKMGRWFIDRGMRKSTPAELHEHVITVYSKTGDWKTRLGVTSSNEDEAFLVVLDRSGVVRWIHHGEFDAARATELGAVIMSAASISP
jgi:hypothetical protein